jgi:hypothetical protein
MSRGLLIHVVAAIQNREIRVSQGVGHMGSHGMDSIGAEAAEALVAPVPQEADKAKSAEIAASCADLSK